MVKGFVREKIEVGLEVGESPKVIVENVGVVGVRTWSVTGTMVEA